MKLRTRLNLVLTGVTAVFVAVLVGDEIRDARSSVREEIEAANRVAVHVLENARAGNCIVRLASNVDKQHIDAVAFRFDISGIISVLVP